MSKDWKVIFVLGGPGAGKSNQCKNLSTDYQLCHLSIGDILLAELKKPDSKYAPIIYKNMTEGTIGPPHITVSLLETAMEEAAEKKRVSVFFIDGFPRDIGQAELFESTTCAPSRVLFLGCPMSVLHERLIWRSKVAPRLDDGNMQKRFETFVKTTVPVIDYYKTQGKVVRIEASPRVEEVYKEIQLATCDILVEVLVRL